VLLNVAELMDNILTHASLAQHAAKIAQMESAAMISRSLAHDLNNLTMPVATYLLHTQGRAAPGSAEEEVYDAALHSVKVMHDYIRESLFFSKRLVVERREIVPAAVLESVVRLAQEKASGRGVTLRTHYAPLDRFQADPVLLQRLALNLINNAIDASPRFGAVTISVVPRHGDQVCLRVEDTGVGITPENIRRIFDPYFTTKDTGDTARGLGLGLAICRKIAELHGGDVEVTSAPGKGAVFTAVFPQSRPADEPVVAARKPSLPEHGVFAALRTYASAR
jgi:signal transduction histidine kinase